MKTLNFILSLSIILVFSACSLDSTSENAQESEYNALLQQKREIEAMAKSEACLENSGCDYVAFGSKPCGGSWSYLAYSTAIDEDLFLEKVAEFNAAESAFNTKWGITSDCEVVAPPTSVECINGVCTAIY